ncbi:MAG: acyl-CoA dehydrogenase family protein [Bdellovibrionaceae bacterium]|nr:acyl-CoA dehydrogenase family protein [Pseudobdellovibrionaceae bacterium]MBX3034221.1 acyl-CoA dehydrogenase family protein [Pseudobdellovibrionaceae bacterium]
MSFSWKEFDLYNPTPEHGMLRETVRAFTEAEVEPQAHEYDRKEEFNLPLFRKLGELGLLGITVPEEYGGSGLDATAAVIVHEELSASDPGFCLAYLAHSMLAVNNLAVNGGEEQKKKYLPRLCSGEWVGSMAMSEPAVGTDVLGMQTTAVKKGDDWVINGRKMWITNGTIDEKRTPCDFIWVYAKTGEKNGRPQLSTFVVEKTAPGFAVGQKIHDKLGMRASNTAELVFQDCHTPLNNLVGHEGDSVLHMMRNLELERLTLAAMSLGIARRSLEIMNRYSQERESFGKPLSHFGQIQTYIANSYAEYKAARAYVYETARRMDLNKEGNRADSDGVKLVATTMAKNVADRAIQVLGGYGYVGEYVVERLWRDAKLLEIGGGTIEAHQKNITRDLAKQPELIQR